MCEGDARMAWSAGVDELLVRCLGAHKRWSRLLGCFCTWGVCWGQESVWG